MPTISAASANASELLAIAVSSIVVVVVVVVVVANNKKRKVFGKKKRSNSFTTHTTQQNTHKTKKFTEAVLGNKISGVKNVEFVLPTGVVAHASDGLRIGILNKN